MKLYSVTFDESNVVVIEPGLEIVEEAGERAVNLGTDVGGATLAMVSLRIPVSGAIEAGDRVVRASVTVSDEGRIAFGAPDSSDQRALAVLSVIQKSPDARTEIEPYASDVSCIGNAFDRPMDKQILVLEPGANVRFRRFGRGGNFGPWEAISWDGNNLSSKRSAPDGT